MSFFKEIPMGSPKNSTPKVFFHLSITSFTNTFNPSGPGKLGTGLGGEYREHIKST